VAWRYLDTPSSPQLKTRLRFEQYCPSWGVPLGERVWEQANRTRTPSPDQELSDDYNPLEAGLWQTISFEKGCYIGQETIARLNTYKGVAISGGVSAPC